MPLTHRKKHHDAEEGNADAEKEKNAADEKKSACETDWSGD